MDIKAFFKDMCTTVQNDFQNLVSGNCFRTFVSKKPNEMVDIVIKTAGVALLAILASSILIGALLSIPIGLVCGTWAFAHFSKPDSSNMVSRITGFFSDIFSRE